MIDGRSPALPRPLYATEAFKRPGYRRRLVDNLVGQVHSWPDVYQGDGRQILGTAGVQN